jgi:hypothetical protein
MTRATGDLPTVFLHIGTPKSGTTYLQSRLDANRQRAADEGLMWPGPRWGVQVEAVRELRALEEDASLPADGPWMRLVDAVHAWDGPRALISMEWMAGCSPSQVAAAVQSLAPARVEVVCTTRDLLRMFVAQWQEMTKNCRPWSWQQFVDEMVGETPGLASRRFWLQQDVPVILERWGQQVPFDRFHVVTVPPSGADPEVLWERFCTVLGIDGTSFEQPPRTNESIGVVSASLMHRVNLVALEQGLDRVDYQRVLHRRFAEEVLAPRRGSEASIAVSPEVDAWIRTRAIKQVDDIRALGLHVVGDLDELIPGEALQGREPSDVSDSELLDTAVEAIVTFAMAQDAVVKRLREENRTLRQHLQRLRKHHPESSPEDPDAGETPIARSVPDRAIAKSRGLARRMRSGLASVVRGRSDRSRR